MSTDQFKADCIKWRGRPLTGKFAHWCYDWDGLPVDETCAEFSACCCAFQDADGAKAAREILEEECGDGAPVDAVLVTDEMRVAGFESEAWELLAAAVSAKRGWPYSCRESAECCEAIFRAMYAEMQRTHAKGEEPPMPDGAEATRPGERQ